MGLIKDAFANTFRPFVTDGVPASGANMPSKAEASALGGLIEQTVGAAIAGICYYATGAERQADTSRPVGTFGKAADEPDFYRKTASGWVVDNTFYEGVATVVQPIVDEATDAAIAVDNRSSVAFRSPFQPNATFAGAIPSDQFRRFLLDVDLTGYSGYDSAKFYSFAEITKRDDAVFLRLYSATDAVGGGFALTGIEFVATTTEGYDPDSLDVFVIKNAAGAVAIVPGALPSSPTDRSGINYEQAGLDDHVFRTGYGAFLRSLEVHPSGATVNPRLVLPAKVHALVGVETTLYYDAIALLPDVGANDPPYLFDVSCDIGAHVRRGYRVTPLAVGNHPLTVSVYDNTGAVMATAATTLVVVAAQNPGSTKRILGVADSTWDDTGEMPKTLQQNMAALPGTVPTFIGTHGAAPYNFEARSGQTLAYFARGAVRHRLTVTGFPNVPFWPILNVYGTDGVGFALLYDEIHVSGGSGTITGLVVGDLQQRIEQPGWAGQLRIDGYDQTFTVTGVERLDGYSPFKDANGTGTLNFANYASRNGVAAADLLVIELGINDSRGALQNEAVQQQKITDAKALCAAFFAWRSSGKVLVCLPKSCASTRAEAAQHDAYRLNIHRFRELLIESFDAGAYDTRVSICASGLMIDRFYGYTVTNPVVGARYTETQAAHPDQVHPRAEGYHQLADAMTPAVLAALA